MVAGKRFKAAAWMIQQAEQFKELAVKLTEEGCEISIIGEGLLTAVMASMTDEMALIDGIYWPSRDTQTRAAVLETLMDLAYYVGECPQRRTAVQAGGNVGIWPKHLAAFFNKVVTFEPDALNYSCLKRNVTEENIEHYEQALGQQHERASIAREAGNCGASALAKGSDVEVIPLDALELQDVDLLQLDVEGAELQALKGAARTIDACSPLIVLELKGLGARYGYTDTDVEAWLHAMRYERVGVAHRDVIFKRRAA